MNNDQALNLVASVRAARLVQVKRLLGGSDGRDGPLMEACKNACESRTFGGHRHFGPAWTPSRRLT